MAERARNYQVKCDRKVEELLNEGKRPLAVMPTGAGKTYTARMRLKEARRPAAITHTKTLRDQTIENIPEVEVFMVQGLLANGPKGAARRHRLSKSGLIWVDEAHHPVKEKWLGLLEVIGDIACFGSTATPQRSDGTPLSEFWTDIVVGAQYSELLALGHLCPCDVAEPDMNRQAQRKAKVRPDGVASYLKLGRRDDGGWRPAIHTDQTIAQCEAALRRYEEHGIRCALVCDDTADEERQRLFDMYSAGWLDLLASPMALSEGFDSPRAEVLVSQRTFSGQGTYIQWCGRILRPYTQREIDKWTAKLEAKGIQMHPSALVAKARALFIDTTDAKSIHGTPTQDRAYSLDGRGMEQLEELEEEEPKVVEREPREPPREVEVDYKIVQDKVVEHFLSLERMAAERGYKPGWVYYQMRELGLDPPRRREALFPDACAHCHKTVGHRRGPAKGEVVLWAGGHTVYHPPCFFSSLDKKTLDEAANRLRLA
jgi:superfamily II DNA or RNA helicase